MTRDDIIRMAREAGMEQDGDNFFSPSHEEIDVHISDLERFAQLVAAAEREQMVFSNRDAWVLAEREACAKACDELVIEVVGNSALAVDQCARAIRARGQQ